MKTNYGINIYAVSVQNEPNYDTTNYESCIWTGQQFHDFLPYLYNALDQRWRRLDEDHDCRSRYYWDFDFTTSASMNDVTIPPNMVGILAAPQLRFQRFSVELL